MADALDLGSSGVIRRGSSPLPRTIKNSLKSVRCTDLRLFFCNLNPELRFRKTASAYWENFFLKNEEKLVFRGFFLFFICAQERKYLKRYVFLHFRHSQKSGFVL